jgi:hypothetical protein
MGRVPGPESAVRIGTVSFEQQQKAFLAHNHVMIPA